MLYEAGLFVFLVGRQIGFTAEDIQTGCSGEEGHGIDTQWRVGIFHHAMVGDGWDKVSVNLLGCFDDLFVEIGG